MVKRRVTAAIAVILGFAAAAAFANGGQEQAVDGAGPPANEVQQSETERMTFEELAISVAVPTTWGISATGPDEVTLFSAQTDEEDDFSENMEFRTYPATGLLDNDRFSRQAIQGFESLPGYRELSRGSARVGGRDARSIHFMAESEDGIVEILAYFFVQNDAAMSIMAGAPAETFDEYEPVFRRIVRSVEPVAPPRNPAGLRVRTYTVNEYELAIRLPMIWNVGSSGPFELYALAPSQGEDDTFRENLAIDILDIEEGTDLDTFSTALAQQMSQVPGFEQIEAGSAEIAGEDARYLIADASQDGVDGRVFAAFWIHEGVGYSAAGWATPETFDEYRPQFEHALSTIRYTDEAQ